MYKTDEELWPQRIASVVGRAIALDLPKGRAARHRNDLAKSIEEFGPPPPSMWLVSGNVVPTRTFGHEEAEVRHGLRLFKGDARIVVVRVWRNASPSKVTVVARHRQDHKYRTSVVDTCFLYNLRVTLVRSPFIISQHWEIPQQRLCYGRNKQAAEAVLAELQSCSAGERARA